MIDEAATLIETANHWNGREGQTPRYIILHGTASNGPTTAQNIANYFRSTENEPNPVSSNYIADQAGDLVCSVPEDCAAYGNGFLSSGHAPWWSTALNPNLISISIECVKPDTENATPLTLAQQETVFALVDRICNRHDIPRRMADATGGITGHFSVDPQNRAHCPGTFPWDALIAALNGGVHMARVPLGWHDDGSTLTAPNGVQVRAGFRNYILNNPWKEEDIPERPEEGRAHLEMSNPGLGGGTRLVCRETILEWTPARGVFPMWVGQELLKLESLLHL